MNTYRVGGSIRDQLLGLANKDNDWVVTGATPQQMLEQGFKPVGKDFPVFLHPQTHEEYALARTERKTAPGYSGFHFNTDPNITLEQDLARRDLTINAIAEDQQGKLIDPFNGKADLENRTLRHVSQAFIEDPVRVLRIARFAARFHRFGFTIAKETQDLIQQMVVNGELQALVPERVWAEMSQALMETDPQVFFTALREANALHALFPEINNLFGVPQTARYHPEVDTGVHNMMALKQSALLGYDLETRYAVLCHDFGKAETPPEILPSHHGHEKTGVEIARSFSSKWKVPKKATQLALMTCEFHTHVHRIFEMKPKTILKFFNQVDAFRRPERMKKMTDACIADARGRTGFESDPYPQAAYCLNLLKQLNDLDFTLIKNSGLTGQDIAIKIDRLRVECIEKIHSQNPIKSNK